MLSAAISASETLIALGVAAGVDAAGDGEAGCWCVVAAISWTMTWYGEQRLAAPVLGDEGEQAVLDAVPFAGAGRVMGDGDGQPGSVGELLQFDLP